jgi:hypothetical protein
MPGRTQHFYFKGAYWSLLRREFEALVDYIGRRGYVPDLEMFHAQRLSRTPKDAASVPRIEVVVRTSETPL